MKPQRRNAVSLPRLAALPIAVAIIITSTGAGRAWAEDWPGPLFISAGELTRPDGTPVGGPVSLHGDTAVIGTDGIVLVFHRAPQSDVWYEAAALIPSDGTTGFGRSVATDGRTLLVGADGSAYVFQREPNDLWHEIATLTGTENSDSFGHSVAVNGTTAVVGAPVPDVMPPGAPGLAYVFERDRGGPNAWGEVARLMGPPHPGPRMVDVFGSSVAIDQDIVIVGAFSPRTIPDGFISSTSAYVFSRDHGGTDAWGFVATLPLLPLGAVPDTFPAAVAISGNTVIVGSFRPAIARIFEPTHDDPTIWDAIAQLSPAFVESVSVSGDLAVVSSRFSTGGLTPVSTVFARNQGGADAWGEVARLPFGTHVAIHGDTLLISTDQTTATYVVDVDRDGLRDGADPCPRDPWNNVAGQCQRSSAAHPVLNELVTLTDLTVVSAGQPFVIRATFTNHSDTALVNPFFEVTTLTGGHTLINADEGSGGVGATLSPDVGDGILEPGASMTADFVIQLETRDPFQFRVTLRGNLGP